MHTNNKNLPPPLCAVIDKFTSEHAKGMGDADISVTQLIDSPCIRILRMRNQGKIVTDYSEHLWAVYGSIAGYIMEHSGIAKGNLAELRVTHEVLGMKLKGSIDFLMEDGYLDDYKLTSGYTIQDGGRAEWVAQLNIYRYFMRHENNVELQDMEKRCKGLRIVAMARDWGPRMKEDLPTPVTIIKIPDWTDEQTRLYIEGRINVHKAAMALPEPPVCSDEERWAQPTVFAVMKKGNKTSSRNLPTRIEAESWMAQTGKGDCIVERPGVYTRCENYCDLSACGLCPYYKRKEVSNG